MTREPAVGVLARMTGEERASAVLSYDLVAPGVYGEVAWRGSTVFVNVLIAEREGSGDVGRWLDSLTDVRVIVPLVVSSRLRGMLSRRGFRFDGVWRRERRTS